MDRELGPVNNRVQYGANQTDLVRKYLKSGINTGVGAPIYGVNHVANELETRQTQPSLRAFVEKAMHRDGIPQAYLANFHRLYPDATHRFLVLRLAHSVRLTQGGTHVLAGMTTAQLQEFVARNHQIDKIIFEDLGPLPGSFLDPLGMALKYPNDDASKRVFNIVWGLAGAPALQLNKGPGGDIEDQYGEVIKKIEDMLGSRTNPALWQGKIEAIKARWDTWITYVMEALKNPEDQERGPGVLGNLVQVVGLTNGLNYTHYSRYTYLDAQAGEEHNSIPVKVQSYFTNNIDFGASSLVFAYKLQAPVGNFDAVGDRFPSMKKHLFVSNGAIWLTMRRFTRNSSFIKFKFNSKFGPFDSVYKAITTIPKKFLDGELTSQLNDQYPISVVNYMQPQGGQSKLAEAVATIQFTVTEGGFFFTNAAQRDIIALGLNGTFVTRQGFKEHICLKATLAKWFWGKKKALQKVAEDRIKRYLDKDRKDLSKVYHFFGTELPKTKY